jgi:hypothetical protein
MNRAFRWMLVGIGAFMLAEGAAFALTLGDNITISDGVFTGTGWYSNREDQEVEPNNVTGQVWDLEGFFLDDEMLSVVGGFNFAAGQDGWDAGDVFLDITGDARYGTANTGTGGDQSYPAIINNTFGYDYVLDINWGAGTYDVYALDAGSTVRVYYNQNDESNPWRYNSGGELLYDDVSFSYLTGLSNADVGGLLGGSHNVAAFDLSFLDPGEFTSHLTVECGNDNLMGQGVIVPEPATASLLVLGLAFMAGRNVPRKKSRI